MVFSWATEACPATTILSVDGIGAHDHMSRQSLLQALQRAPRARAALPFARLFYGRGSTYVWTDSRGCAHLVHQRDGGEQEGPSMPALFSLGLDSPLRSFAAELRPDERVLAFLDDMYVTAQPALHARLAHVLESSVGIRLHVGKTILAQAILAQASRDLKGVDRVVIEPAPST